MSLKKVHDNQPKEFKFTEGNLKKAEKIIEEYKLRAFEKLHILDLNNHPLKKYVDDLFRRVN